MSSLSDPSISAAFFCPAPSLATGADLDRVRDVFICHEPLKRIGDALLEFGDVWNLICNSKGAKPNFSKRGGEYASFFKDWITLGKTEGLAGQSSTMVTLPVLLLDHLAQYFQFRNLSRQSHSQVLAGLSVGGCQGYCGGLLGALCVASAVDDEELVIRAGNCLRVAFVLGFYMSEDEDGPRETRRTTLIVRLKYEGQHEELTSLFPGVYPAAMTDPRNICFAGTEAAIARLAKYASDQGMHAQHTYPTGSGHDPHNRSYVDSIMSLVSNHQFLKLPTRDQLQVPMMSNWDGNPLLSDTNVAEDVVGNIVAGRCHWSTLVTKTAERLRESGSSTHCILILGQDCVSQRSFQQASLVVSKINLVKTVREIDKAKEAELPDDAVAIVGAALRQPGANDLDELWEVMVERRSMCEEVRQDRTPLESSFRARFDQNYNTHGRKFWANYIDDVRGFDHELFGITPREAQLMDPQQRLLLEVSYEALEASGYLAHRNYRRRDNDNVGCFIGATVVEYEENTSSRAPTAYTATGTLQAFLCGRLSYYFGWKGPSETIDTACSSSLVAINRACSALRGAECRMAVVGGSNVLGGVNLYLDLAKARFLSPTGQCRPFDRDADGYCRSDGVGVLVLKLLKDAKACGDPILGVITAVGTNQGGLSASITLPDQRAQVELFRRNLDAAGLEPSDISYVECHGTGTKAGDPSEVGAVLKVFGDARRDASLYIGSVKGNIGHCEPAAGITGVLKVLAMLRKGKIPPQASFQSPNPSLPPLGPSKVAIPTTVKVWDAPRRAAVVNSYGAAGSNASLICCEYTRTPSSSVWGWWLPTSSGPGRGETTGRAPSALPLMLTAASPSSVKANCLAVAAALRRQDRPSPVDAAFTLSEKRERHAFRIVMTVANDVNQMVQKLEESVAIQAEAVAVAAAASVTKIPAKPRHVVLVFGGQSRRAVHLDRRLYDTNARLREHMDECHKVVLELGYGPILPAIFDRHHDAGSSFSSQDVVVLQLALFLINYSCAQCWLDAGLQVDAVIGHSLGELVALVFSGALSLRQGIQAVASRASLMKSCWTGERGTMLAIHAAEPVLTELLAAVQGGLEIACYNSASSHVVVGTAAEVVAAETFLSKAYPSVKHQRVDTTHGFHSRFTEVLVPGLRELEELLDYKEPWIPLEPCVRRDDDGLSDPGSGPVVSSGHIARHVRDPVFFGDAVQRIEKRLGSCAWLEAGFDSPVIPMVKRAVANAERHSFHPMRIHDADADIDVALSNAFVSLWRAGVEATFWPWLRTDDAGSGHDPNSPRLVALPRYQFSRTPFWTPAKDNSTDLKAKTEEDAERIRMLEDKLQTLLSNVKQTSSVGGPETPRLVTPHSREKFRYTVDTRCQRFRKIVSSHSVRGRHLCPASLYLECVTMALKIERGGGSDASVFLAKGMDLVFADLFFDKMLGSSLDRKEVCILLQPRPGQHSSWNFSFESIDKTGDVNGEEGGRSSARPVVHARGTIRVETSPSSRHLEHLLEERMSQLRHQPGGVERLLSGRIYSLFTTVVDYDPLLRGLDAMNLHGNSFSGVIKIPRPPLAPEESSVLDIADTCVVDNIVQPLGLAINTGDHCGPGDAYLFSGCESFALSSLCRLDSLESPAEFDVVGSFRQADDRLCEGDIYLLSGGKLAAMVLGARFNRLPIKRIEAMLDRLTPASAAPGGEQLTAKMRSPGSSAAPSLLQKPRKAFVDPVLQGLASGREGRRQSAIGVPPAGVSNKSSACEQTVHETDIGRHNDSLRQLISKFSGVPVSALKPGNTLGDVGLDSLAVIEFCDECRSQLGIEISQGEGDLTQTTIASLILIEETSRQSGCSSSSALKPPRLDSTCPVDCQATNPRKQNSHQATANNNSENNNNNNSLLVAQAPPRIKPPVDTSWGLRPVHNTDKSLPSGLQRVRNIISLHSGTPVEQVDVSETLMNLGVDSLAIVEIRDSLQEAFGAAGFDENLIDLNTTPEGVWEEDTWRGKVMSKIEDLCGVPKTTMSPTDTLANLGFDSLAIEELRDILQVELGPDSLQSLPTLSELTIGDILTASRAPLGVVPVSVDYRLCPEVSFAQGIADVLDAYRWALRDLPGILRSRAVEVDLSNVVVIGWSSGGHLAVALSWLIQENGLPPLKGIMTLHAPLSWVEGAVHEHSPKRAIPDAALPLIKRLVASVPRKPLVSADDVLARGFATDFLGLKWARPDDPRSQLMAGVVREVRGPCLPLLLKGLPPSNDDQSIARALEPVDANRVVSLCPMAQARRGRVKTPTIVVHGVEDDIVPLQDALVFRDLLHQHGVECSVLSVSGAGHGFDMTLRYGSERWEATVRPAMNLLFKYLRQDSDRIR
ncbi:Putative Acyl transferase domain superfamily, peptidase S9, prolyl oligopeptidase, catalytic [Colletotrichum destructivum]|uniref:Acyl transferase domain superfamily, peptidase S9, prolyl oligopeptidase, catalytic n=1 Tax=Colletotrichum destructivum TaxID=34406 RepID=A0AAX4I1C4_9PEZI|nr:Putative Acyl transferase domain superfamily, peptidase S9, prolyl oligopeptidase, catalytic [Colletotrichum destructivum]